MIDQVAGESVQDLDKIAVQYAAYVDATVDAARQQVAATADPDPAAAQSIVSQLLDHLQQGADGTGDAINKARAELEQAMVQGATSIDADLDASNNTASGTLTETASQLVSTLDREGQAAVDGLTRVATDTATGAAKVVNDYVASVHKAVDDALAGLRSTIADGMSKISAEVDHGIAESEGKLGDLPGKLDQAAEKAAEPFDAPWYKRVGNFLLGALKAIWGLVKILLIVAVVVIIAVLAGVAFELILAIAAVIAIIAMVAVAIMSVIARFKSYSAEHGSGPGFWAGFGIVCLGVLDVAGVPNMIEAGMGHRFFSEETLDDEQRGELFTHGLIALVTTLLFVKELTAAGEIARAGEAVVAGEELAIGGEELAGAGEELAGTGEKIAGSGEELAGSGEELAGSGEKLSSAGTKAWNDTSLSPSEGWAAYKEAVPNWRSYGRTWNWFQNKFASGLRYNPANSRWMNPSTLADGTGVVSETAGAGEKIATGGEELAASGEELARGTERVTASAEEITASAERVSKATAEAVKVVEEVEPALEKVIASGDAELADAGRSLRSGVHEFLEHRTVLEGIEHAETSVIRAVQSIITKVMGRSELLTKLLEARHLADLDHAIHAADMAHHALERIMQAIHTWHAVAHPHGAQNGGEHSGGHSTETSTSHGSTSHGSTELHASGH